MRNSGQDDLFYVGQDGFECLAVHWGLRWQRGANLPGFYPRKHRERFDPGMVVGDPVDHGVAVTAKLLGRHVKGRFFVGHRKLRVH